AARYHRPPGLQRGLPSFPTRRSSDLKAQRAIEGEQDGDGMGGSVEPPAAAEAEMPSGNPAASDDPVQPQELRERLNIFEDGALRSEEHTSELQSRENLVCRLLRGQKV